MTARPLIEVGDVLDLDPCNYRQLGDGTRHPLRITVTHLPDGASTWEGSRMTLTGSVDGRDLVLSVHRRAMPGYEIPPAPDPRGFGW